MKNLYKWVLSLGDSKYGIIALFVLAIMESSFFPIPPDVLLIALCLGFPKRSFYYAAICTLGSIIGAIVGYEIGNSLWYDELGEYTSIANFFFNNIFSENGFLKVKVLYEEYNFWAIFTAGLTPIPYKIFTITAGVFNIDLGLFVIASIIGRLGRFLAVGTLIWYFGTSVKGFIDKYFNILVCLFAIIIICSFMMIKLI